MNENQMVDALKDFIEDMLESGKTGDQLRSFFRHNIDDIIYIWYKNNKDR
jgi:hypothetical protein